MLDNTSQDFLADSGLGDSASEGGDMGKAQRRGVMRIETEGCSRHVQNSPDNGDGNFDFWIFGS